MAHIEGGNSGGRNVNSEVNLVPFIDLMSVCIIFLLVTAVWTQVSMIELGSSVYGKDTGQMQNPTEKKDFELELKVKKTGFYLKMGAQRMNLPMLDDGKYDIKGLFDQLSAIKEKYPEKNNAIIALEEDLKYENMISGMDVLLNAGFAQISVATGN